MNKEMIHECKRKFKVMQVNFKISLRVIELMVLSGPYYKFGQVILYTLENTISTDGVWQKLKKAT